MYRKLKFVKKLKLAWLVCENQWGSFSCVWVMFSHSRIKWSLLSRKSSKDGWSLCM